MAIKVNIPRYTSKDFPIMVATMLPGAVLMNYFLYGTRYFSELNVFVLTTIVSFLALCLAYLFYGLVAISLRNRFPGDDEVFKRLTITITIFVLITGVYLSVVCRAYDLFDFMGYEYNEANFSKCFIAFVTMNIFLTFLNEGVSRYENYRNTLTETEQLKKEYMQSQLLGLKSQMNPHFLFNGLNILSCLIQEDAEKAEEFLDHMSKVYRYLLRNNEEQLVDLQTEISFIRSYYFLLKQRYAEGLQLSISVDPESLKDQLPPLTLQMIFENVLANNTISKNCPLHIEIHSSGDELIIKNSIQPKLNCVDCCEEVLENVANKYKLLCQKQVVTQEALSERIIRLPLIPCKELIEA